MGNGMYACVLQDTRWENAAAILDAWLQSTVAAKANVPSSNKRVAETSQGKSLSGRP